MNDLSKKVIFNIPNMMTYGRILLVPVIIVLMVMQKPGNDLEFNRIIALVTAGVFILAAISDIVDGYYARKYKMVSLMGKFFDPIADKLIHMTALVMMVSKGWFPDWLAVFLIFREILISGLRSVAAGEGVIIDAGKLGKKKTICLNIGLSALLIHYDIFGVSSYTVGWFAIVLATYYSIVSAAEYLIGFFREVSKKNRL